MLILSFSPFFSYGQNTISGTVIDELGLPIYLASVELEQTDEVTYTDYNGSFSLTSKKNFHWKIRISSKGYKTESFFVLDGGSTESILLEYDAEMKKLLEGNSSLFKTNLYSKMENSLALH